MPIQSPRHGPTLSENLSEWQVFNAYGAVSDGCVSGVQVPFSPRKRNKPVGNLRQDCLIVPEHSKGVSGDKMALCYTWKKDVGKTNELA